MSLLILSNANMSNFCLPKFAADIFKVNLKNGEIDPEALAKMSSEDRRAVFAKFVGENNAKEVNVLFEQKKFNAENSYENLLEKNAKKGKDGLSTKQKEKLLKTQQEGIKNWIRQVVGLKPEIRKDALAKVDRMTEILTPSKQRQFLEDLAEQRLGTHVSAEEAGKIAQLAKNVNDAKTTMEGAPRREAGAPATPQETAYGKAKVEFGNYVADLKNSNKPGFVERLKTNPVGLAGELPGLSKGLKASLDDSAIFRQGWKTLFTHPATWWKNAAQSFSDLVRQFGGKEVMDEVHASILSNPDYEAAQKAGLDIGTTEEQFPSHLAEKVPLVGRAYKASEAAYTGFVYRQRMDIFSKYLQIAKKAGVDVTDKEQLQSIGKLVNSLTGRGNLGRLEPAAGAINNVFFSPRFLKSNIDFLTAHQLQKGVTPFVRKQAAINLVKVIAGTAAILGIANAAKPGSVELDPRSSNFGKIKIGSTTFDVSGGMGSILTLAARLATLSSKSPTTGKVTALNSGKYGAQTGADVLVNFAEGKASPIASIALDILRGEDFNYNKPTVFGEANNLLTPLPITNAMSLYQTPNGANPLAGIIADSLGISVNTLSKPKKK